jgi:hypothetical protein
MDTPPTIKRHWPRLFVTAFSHLASSRYELIFWGGCQLAFWLIDAASMSGYVIAALFPIVAIGRAAKKAIDTVAARMPKRSVSRHRIMMLASVALFGLLVVRGCYIASVIVDSEYRTGPVEIFAGK